MELLVDELYLSGGRNSCSSVTAELSLVPSRLLAGYTTLSMSLHL